MDERCILYPVYRPPADIDPKEMKLRHMMDFENMTRIIVKLDNKQGRLLKHGQSATEGV